MRAEQQEASGGFNPLARRLPHARAARNLEDGDGAGCGERSASECAAATSERHASIAVGAVRVRHLLVLSEVLPLLDAPREHLRQQPATESCVPLRTRALLGWRSRRSGLLLARRARDLARMLRNVDPTALDRSVPGGTVGTLLKDAEDKLLAALIAEERAELEAETPRPEPKAPAWMPKLPWDG